MAQIQTYECDICHTQKKEVNHWWIARKHKVGDGHPNDELSLYIQPIDRCPEKYLSVSVHLCGFDCVTKWLHQQMQEIINRENTNRTAGSDKVKV
jgi:hypothetical protein